MRFGRFKTIPGVRENTFLCAIDIPSHVSSESLTEIYGRRRRRRRRFSDFISAVPTTALLSPSSSNDPSILLLGLRSVAVATTPLRLVPPCLLPEMLGRGSRPRRRAFARNGLCK